MRISLGVLLVVIVALQGVCIGQLMYDINPFSHSSTACYKSNWFILKNIFKMGLPLFLVLKPGVLLVLVGRLE